MILMLEAGASHERLFYLMTHGLLLPIVAGLIVLFWRNRGWLEKLSGGRAFQAGGQASLLIYLFHYPWFFMGYAAIAMLTKKCTDEICTSPAIFFSLFCTLLILCYWIQPNYSNYEMFCKTLLGRGSRNVEIAAGVNAPPQNS
jgi:peptidoglycan/LPS O-acetylase OafA/YrhL